MSDLLLKEKGKTPAQFVEPKQNYLSLEPLAIKKASLVFRALNHVIRQQMIKIIQKKDRVSVTEIFVEMRLEQSVASQHLAILRRAGIVKPERDGKFMYYRLNKQRLDLINKIIADLLG
jgi:ArsR family transcriptional regulator, virulence genes transcriptional regulator